MRGIVMETDGDRAVVLLKGGDFKEIKNKGYKVGDKIDIRPGYMPQIASIAAAVMIFAVGGASYFAPASYVTMDINPSFIMTLNVYDKVINIEPLNDDAKKVLDTEKIKGGEINHTIEELIGATEREGYLKSDGEVVMTVVPSIRTPRLGDISKAAGVSVTVARAGTRELAEAKKRGVTPAKARVIEEYEKTDVKNGAKFTVGQLKDFTIGDIKKEIEKNRGGNAEVEDTPIYSANSNAKPNSPSDTAPELKTVSKSAEVRGKGGDKKVWSVEGPKTVEMREDKGSDAPKERKEDRKDENRREERAFDGGREAHEETERREAQEAKPTAAPMPMRNIKDTEIKDVPKSAEAPRIEDERDNNKSSDKDNENNTENKSDDNANTSKEKAENESKDYGSGNRREDKVINYRVDKDDDRDDDDHDDDDRDGDHDDRDGDHDDDDHDDDDHYSDEDGDDKREVKGNSSQRTNPGIPNTDIKNESKGEINSSSASSEKPEMSKENAPAPAEKDNNGHESGEKPEDNGGGGGEPAPEHNSRSSRDDDDDDNDDDGDDDGDEDDED